MKIDKPLIRPILTEKATKLASGAKVYMFEIDQQANKSQTKKTLENLYQVKVAHVTVANRKGKSRRVGRRMMPRKSPDRKIAYVKIASGTIDIFPQT